MKRTNTSRKVIGYIRVSTIDQDTEKNEAAILKYANERDFGQVQFISEKVSGAKSWKNRKLATVVDDLTAGDVLIVPELSRLGRSLHEILDLLNILKDKQVKVLSVKEDFQLNGDDIQSKMMRTLLGLFAEIERDLISARTKEGIEAARRSGKQLGRPKGTYSSKLDEHREEIIDLIRNGASRRFIADRYEISTMGLLYYLKKHDLDKIKPTP